MNIRPKFILAVLPLIITPLLFAGFIASLSARNGITAVATSFLRFKSETLTDYMEGQWRLLQENNLDTDPDYREVARQAMETFARNLIRSRTELILALDTAGEITLSTAEVTLTPDEITILSSIDPLDSSWRSLALVGVERVAHIAPFAPYGWTVFVTEARETFYGAVTRIYWQTGIILAVAILLSMVLLIIVTGYVSRPLEGMVKAIENIIVTGDLKIDIPTLYQDETGKLAHSFNIMTAELDKAYEKIKGFALKAVVAQRKEQKIRNIFQKYVPRTVIDQFFANPEGMLVGDNRILSVLFSDIRGFTKISEKMLPDEMVESLNKYFETMVDVIIAHHGVIDKYIGDAIMSFFGAPEKRADDTKQAVLASLGMLDALDDFNRWQEKKGRPPFRIGIGVNYGVVTIGNIGSEKKMDYTVIGDMVNLASRLEGATKIYGVPLIISESLQRKVADDLPTRVVDKIIVKGRTQPVNIYTAAKEMTPEKQGVWHAYEAGLELYYERDFKGAKDMFVDALRLYPDDIPSRIFLSRSEKLIKTPPPEKWTGAEELTEK